ncbi:type 1 glutamine amidotransferase [Loigolactobacillus binensis]|uniref:Type 1 glutamine amidotransferase n=1 Tax=Loigolactobacillus binensis TaxID=2559922 RepID=A0ABW3EC61_9LACO|nr:type 1 glutamine amidotransferase [Loigolactobacillus binensis]
MRINVLQHTSNEGPGAIRIWAHRRQHQLYIYHPDQFGILPSAATTDMLVLLGGPQSVNDNLPWIAAERRLLQQLLARQVPIFGVCFGAQQISKALGGEIKSAATKEVGWAPIYLQATMLSLPAKLTVLHWHQETFTLPQNAQRLFASRLFANQGFIYQQNVVGLQFHLETLAENVREIVVNDGQYTVGSALNQTPQAILDFPVPAENQRVLFQLLDRISQV